MSFVGKTGILFFQITPGGFFFVLCQLLGKGIRWWERGEFRLRWSCWWGFLLENWDEEVGWELVVSV